MANVENQNPVEETKTEQVEETVEVVEPTQVEETVEVVEPTQVEETVSKSEFETLKQEFETLKAENESLKQFKYGVDLETLFKKFSKIFSEGELNKIQSENEGKEISEITSLLKDK